MSRMSGSYVGVADPSRTTTAGPASSATGSGSWVLGSSAAPVRPQTRIAPGQAKYTTYASRMRAGTTTLMQPIWRGSYDMEDTLGHSGRGRHTVYYGEDVSDDDEIEEADDDDDDDFESPDEEYGSQPRSKRRRSHLDDRASNSPAARPEPSDVEAEAEWASPGSQLGLPVPSRRLVVRPARPVRPPYFSDEQLAQQGECPEVLVPIRVEFHTDTHRIKDVFLWNINERLITPYQFAHMFLQDLDLPITPHAAQIENLIIQQLADASAVLDSEDGLSRIIDLKTAARERKRLEAETEAQRRRLAATQAVADSASPLSAPRKRGRPRKYPMPDAKEETPTAEVAMPTFSNVPSVIPASTAAVTPHEEDPKAVEKARIHSMLASVDAEDDLRVIVEYKVQIARHILRDRLEWDLGSTWTPEAFARTLMRDLGLPPESRGIIAHAVHEQLLHHRRAASELGLFGSGKIYQCTMDELVQIERAEQAQQSEASAMENGTMEEAEGAAALYRRAAASATTELDALDEYAVGVRDEVGPPNTRSRRMAAGSQASDSSLSVPFLIPDETLPLPVRRQQALVTLRDLLALGPRPLEGAWRDFGDAADFGPLLEYLSDAELEKMEEADLRASRYVPRTHSRRNRREAQRTGRTRRG